MSEVLVAELKNVAVVLMKTTHPGNIGAVARAMKTMGLSDLRLVSPKEFPCDEAYRRSSGAEDVLQAARCYDSLDDAIKDSHLVVGASARSRKMVWPLMNPRACCEMLAEVLGGASHSQSLPQQKQVVLLFGQEASGLSNEELQRCNYHVNIPANEAYSSLNLAMAVQVICYELRMTLLARTEEGLSTMAAQAPQQGNWDIELASNEDVERFIRHLEQTLVKLEFHDPKKPRMLINRLRRLFQRAHMDAMEVNIMRGIMTAIQKKIP